MSRRKLIWHLGLALPPRPVISASLEAHRDALEADGIRVVASSQEARLATHELLRTHRRVGLSRAEVEGRWARMCDRVWQHKGVSLLSTPDLCAADKDQIKLALNPLIGVEVHLVVTLDSFSQQLYGAWLGELRSGRATGWDKYIARVLAPTPEHRQAEQYWAGHDVPAVLSRWGWTLHPDRLHVLADRDTARHWAQLLEVAGVPAADLDPVVPSYADPAGVAVLRKVNRQLEDSIHPGAVDLLTVLDHERSAMPVASTGLLLPMVETWKNDLSVAGHDLRGDLALLVDQGEEIPLPGPHDQLGVAVDALAEALAENTRLHSVASSLEADLAGLERKRRKLKRRLKRARSEGSPRN